MTQQQQPASTTNVFNTEIPAAAAPTEQQPKYFDELVGEGKKFKDQEALAKAKLESDKFIDQMKAEAEELRKELKKKLDAEEILEDLKRGVAAANNPAQPAKQPETSPEDLGKLVDEKLQERETQRAYEANVFEADKYITEKLGGKAEAMKFIEGKAEEFGINKSWLMDMAGRTPKALYAVLGLDEPNKAAASDNRTSQQPIVQKSTVKRENTFTGGLKTKAYYDEIRRTNPSAYFSPKVQNEIFKASSEGKYE